MVSRAAARGGYQPDLLRESATQLQSLRRAVRPDSVAVVWKTQSATPAGDFLIIPQFRVERSRDLKTWTLAGGVISSSLGQTNVFFDSAADFGFYRVNSIIERNTLI